MPVGRGAHAAAGLDGHLYVMGGYVDKEGISSRVDRFDPTRNEWESVAPFAVESHCGPVRPHAQRVGVRRTLRCRVTLIWLLSSQTIASTPLAG